VIAGLVVAQDKMSARDVFIGFRVIGWKAKRAAVNKQPPFC
jgi:hypothetical protein